MKLRQQIAALGAALVFLLLPAHAQNVQSADYVVAVVNSDPITNSEVRAAILRVTEQIKARGQTVPVTEELRQSVLDRLISDRAQLQLAKEYGIRIDDAAVDVAEQNLARQSKQDVDAYRQSLAKLGISQATLRTQLLEQLTLQRLREREVESRVRISDQDVDRAVVDQLAANEDPYVQDINLAQLLIAVPERADASLAAQLQAQAQALLARIRAGENFSALVKQYSNADRSKDGELGLRRADRYPPVFVEATKSVAVGATSELVRSGAGFHILKVVERKAPTTLVKSVTQTRARHILLRITPELTAATATARLSAVRERIVSGKIEFATAARENSQDSSASEGGELGWASPGMFVPEFEDAMNRLKDGEISQPVLSRFGVHLIQVLDKRRIELNPREVRELVRGQLREAKLEESYATWARDVRERAYVEMREAPQ